MFWFFFVCVAQFLKNDDGNVLTQCGYKCLLGKQVSLVCDKKARLLDITSKAQMKDWKVVILISP